MNSRNRLTAAAVSLVLASALPALAQPQESAPAGTAEEPVAMEEVIVTAQKREEHLQDVPISMAALGEATLQAANVQNVLDVMKLVPNFAATRANVTSNVRLAIRGIGAAGNSAIEPSVATFMDGAYIARPGAIYGRFYDVQAVEVLRGPQGTLFGRNASAGVIHIRTNEPGKEFEGSAALEGGSFGYWQATGMVNLPMGERAALRIAAIGNGMDGFATSNLTGDYGSVDSTGGRVSFKLDATDSLTWLLRGDYMKLTGDAAAQFELLPETLTPATTAAMAARLGGVQYLPDVTDPYDRVSNQRIFGDLDDEQWGVNSTLDWEGAGGYTVRLIDSYRDWDNAQQDGDIIFTPRDLSGRRSGLASQAQSHELQLISPQGLMGGKFDFVAGLYYSQEDLKIFELLDLGSEYCTQLGPFIGVQAGFPLGSPQNAAFVNACKNGQQVPSSELQFSQDTENWAAYAQGTFALTEKLGLTLGLRYTQDDKSGDFVQKTYNPAAVTRAPETTPLAFDDSRTTYRVNLAYRPVEDTMLFATYSTGYKSGGFNSGGGTPALGQKRIFDSETVKNYELGFKTTTAGGDVIWNATFYRMDIDGFQDRSFDGQSFVTRNAGSLRQQGVETDLLIRLTRAFRMTLAGAYLDSKFTDYKNAACKPASAAGCVQDLTGTPNIFSPKLSGTFSAQYDGAIPGTGLIWSLRGDVTYVDDASVAGVLDGNPQTLEPSHSLLGARLGIHPLSDRWGLEVFGENLTATDYCSTRVYQILDSLLGLRTPANGGTAVRCQVGNPRTWGVRGSVKF